MSVVIAVGGLVKEKIPDNFEITTLVKGTVLYKQSHIRINENVSGQQWFALKPDYGESYGPYTYAFELKRDVKLLDVAKTKCRDAVSNYAAKHNLVVERVVAESCFATGTRKFTTVRRPLDHAWGEGECTTEAAATVCEVAALFDLDGWIADKWDDEALEGPEEIMLCLRTDHQSIMKKF